MGCCAAFWMLITHGQTPWKWKKKRILFCNWKGRYTAEPTSTGNTSLLTLIRYEFWRYFCQCFAQSIPSFLMNFNVLPETIDKVTIYSSFHILFNSGYGFNKFPLTFLLTEEICEINHKHLWWFLKRGY